MGALAKGREEEEDEGEEVGAPRGRVKIGLEIHCQLTALKTKLFCPCSSDYREREPNELVCPICFGIPGTLPLLNATAVEYAVRVGLALNCELPAETLFFRKNYFYPDLPKNFQISQYDKAGGVAIGSDGFVQMERKRIRIRRIQLEEDPGKLTYEGTIEKSSYSMVDYNRAGIALVEIVTEPDFETAGEAKKFLERLRAIVEALGVSNGELEGAMRCDANVSISGGNRVEIKNISSFKEVEKALNYEILRQSTFAGSAPDGGATETRHWDERRSITISLRVKEAEQDYRYFPEPDLPVVALGHAYVERVKLSMPEVPETRAQRYVDGYGVPAQAAGELARDPVLSSFFERTVKLYDRPPEVANWLIGEFREQIRGLDGDGKPKVTPEGLSELLAMVDSGKATRPQAKGLFRDMLRTGKSASQLAGAGEVSVFSDEAAISSLLDKVLSEGGALEDARSNPRAMNYLIGQVLKLEPRAEPRLIAKMIASKLKR